MFASIVVKLRVAAAIQLSLLLILAAVVGCGSDPEGPPVPTEEDDIYELISGIGDHLGSPRGFKSLFVEGAAPADSKREEYEDFAFGVESMEITGDSARATVSIKDYDGEASAEKEWTLEKHDGLWLLKTAPLPED